MTPAAHQRYVSKLGIGSSHSWALAQCAALPPAARVLDVGAGSGIIGQELRARGFTDLQAVEPDAEARVHIRSFYRHVAENLDGFSPGTFDLVLLLDVLEHLADPSVLFARALGLLAPGGTLLVSVPNVAHWSVRLPLLFGLFDYYDRGILDLTHLHFFYA